MDRYRRWRWAGRMILAATDGGFRRHRWINMQRRWRRGSALRTRTCLASSRIWPTLAPLILDSWADQLLSGFCRARTPGSLNHLGSLFCFDGRQAKRIVAYPEVIVGLDLVSRRPLSISCCRYPPHLVDL